MNTLRPLAFALVLGTAAAASNAGTASGVFEVRITLSTGSVPPVPPGAVVDPPASEPPIAGTNPSSPGLPATPPPGGDFGAGPTPGQPAPPPSGPGPVSPPVATIPQQQQQLLVPTKGTPPGICTGQTLLSGPGATVNVVCSLGQYVTIEPLVRPPFLFGESGEQRFSFGPGSPLPRSLGGRLNTMLPTGTVTALRILNVSNLVSPLEMLVSF